MSTEPIGRQFLERAEPTSFCLQPGEIIHPPKRRAAVLAITSVWKSDEAIAGVSDPRANWAIEEDGLFDSSLWKGMSAWTNSFAKRVFDCICVLLSLPVVVPILLIIAVGVRATSSGPILFLQRRMGRHGSEFTILKFRTMVHVSDRVHNPITTEDNQRFTPIGPFLRRWKLDELPQLFNVLVGHMSLVGPRPKMREHVVSNLPCRPGITGMATSVFAREEAVLTRIPQDRLEEYYHDVLLPTKRLLDSEYMARATFLSDLELIVNSVLRRWDESALEAIIAVQVLDKAGWRTQSRTQSPSPALLQSAVAHNSRRAVEVEHASVM